MQDPFRGSCTVGRGLKQVKSRTTWSRDTADGLRDTDSNGGRSRASRAANRKVRQCSRNISCRHARFRQKESRNVELHGVHLFQLFNPSI